MSDEALDLTGSWSGLFSYESPRPPVSFTAALTEAGGWLSGATEEVATSGPSQGKTKRANLEGRRAGTSVTFLKTYDEVVGGYDSVQYVGAVNGDGSEIEGRWTIFGRATGSFLMIRSPGSQAAVERRAAERV